MWVGSAPAADHVRRVGDDVGGGVAGSGVAARPGAVASLAQRRRRSVGWWAAGGDGGGGLHRVALRGGGDRGGGVRGASRRAGRHTGGAWQQAPRQDRSFRRPVVAPAVAEGRAARVVDPAADRVGVAGAGAVVQVADRSTAGVGAADPRRAVPARRRRTRRSHPLGVDAGTVGRRRRRVDPGGPAADPGRLRNDRRWRRRSGAVEEGPATLREAPAGLSGVGRRRLRDPR